VNVFAATLEVLRTHWTDFSPYLARFEIDTRETSLEQFRSMFTATEQTIDAGERA